MPPGGVPGAFPGSELTAAARRTTPFTQFLKRVRIVLSPLRAVAAAAPGGVAQPTAAALQPLEVVWDRDRHVGDFHDALVVRRAGVGPVKVLGRTWSSGKVSILLLAAGQILLLALLVARSSYWWQQATSPVHTRLLYASASALPPGPLH
jgi:Zn-dependent protease